MGQHMVGWGLPRNTGRVYAYLLLHNEPVSLDRMVADLEIAKSGASVATRQLVQFGMARASGERRSRRVLYEALYNVAAIFEARNAQAAKLLKMYREGAAVASPAARRRLEETSDVVEQLLQEMPSLLRRIQEGRRR
ncbi:MAG: transcriptional regulator [Chloroflexi bacterium]|nr:MAG: transcriptional regulator [Chloroflexota bacterium]